jgi:hypothetical protein
VHGRTIELFNALPAEDHNTLDSAMHAASRQDNLLAQLAASHPPSFGNRSPTTN